jgi:hypothetical protein
MLPLIVVVEISLQLHQACFYKLMECKLWCVELNWII